MPKLIRKSRFVIGVLGVLCGLSGGGCGYALAGRGVFLPSYITTIGIPTFVNRSTVFNVETQLTEKVRSEFIGRGRFKILPDTTDVDAVLTGEVTGILLAPADFSQQQLATRYFITMYLRAEFRDLHDNKVLWEQPNLYFRQEFDAPTGLSSLDPAAYFGQDVNALERMTSDVSQSIVRAILEAF